jgi:hypothetical protein
MRILVLSDSHRRVGNLFEIIEKHMDSTDLFLFLGDIDDDFDEVLLLYPNIKYQRVVGNNDWSSPHSLEGEVIVNGKKIFFCHGHKYHVKFGYGEIIKHCKNIGADICLFGHTHVQYKDYDDGLYIMNPGAVASGEYGIIDIVDNGIMLIPSKI